MEYTIEELKQLLEIFEEEWYEAYSINNETPRDFIKWLEKK